MSDADKILVIKLSALGDFIQSLGTMRAIRNHHPYAHITLLTTKPYVELAQKSGCFNDIFIDQRPKLFQLKKWFNLGKKLNAGKFTRVYDLQCNDRTTIYFQLFLKKPEWVGPAKGASHRDTVSNKKTMLAFHRQQKSLAIAGINNIKIDQLNWMNTDISSFNLKNPYVLIAAGCAPSRPEKKWDTAHYGSLCKTLTEKGFQPVLLGTSHEKEIVKDITKICPNALNLTGKTTLFDIPPLARNAAFAIGNDTGPMHLIGPTGCKTIILFSGSSNPQCHKPLGDNIHTLQKDDMNDITVNDVMEQVNSL